MTTDTSPHPADLTQADPAADPPAIGAPSARDALYRGLVEESLQGILVYRHLRPVFANRAMAELLGYERPEELLALDSLAPLIARVAEPEPGRGPRDAAARLGVPKVTEVTCVRKDGSIAHLRAHSRLVKWMGEPAIHATLIDVTEQHRAEEALREREAQYRDLIEGSLQGIVIHRDRHFLFVNQAYAEALGYASPEAVLVLPSIDPLVHETDRERMREYSERLLRGEPVPAIYFTNAIRKDGSLVEFQVYSRLIQWQGEPAIQSTLIDLTEQHRALRALQASEARYRDLVEGSLQAIVIHRDVRPLFVNRAYASLMGYDSPEEILALGSLLPMMPPAESARLPEMAERRLRGLEASNGYEAEARRKDGRIIIFRAYSRVVDWMGEPAIQTTAIDITEQKQAQTKLRQKEWELARAQQAANIGSWYRNLRTGEMRWSDQTCRIFGKDPATFEPDLETFLDLVHPDDRHLIVQLPTAHTVTDGRFELEHRVRRTDGVIRAVHSIGEVLYDAAGDPEAIIGTLHDITDRKATEQRLAQAQKLEALGRLSGGVAHDFNNLLTIIHGNLELALLEAGDQPRLERLLQAVLDAAHRGADLTRVMLAYSRRQPLSPRVEDVRRIVESVARLLRSSLGAGIELEVPQAAEPLWPVSIDGSQLESAIINLAINARDAMPEGGRLVIRAENVVIAPAGSADAPEVPPGAYVTLTVRDTGEGIPPDLIDRVFEPFFTTKEAGKGSGLGLSMVYGFIRQSGGQIRLSSEPRRGTAVTLFLPRHHSAEPHHEAPAALPDGERAMARGRGHVLVVEDEPEIRRIAERIFNDLGFRVTSLPDAAEALSFGQQHPRFDLLFTDMVLPGRPDGLGLADALRRRQPDLPVVIATGYTENLEALQSRMEQGYVLVEKPYSASIITERLRACGLLDAPEGPAQRGSGD